LRDVLHSWDLFLYWFVNRTLTSPWLDRIALFFSSTEVWSALTLGVFLYCLVRRQKRALKILGCLLVAVSLTDSVSYYFLKPVFQRVRPCHYLQSRRVNGICGSEFGMPSNHAANGVAVTTVLAVFASRFWLFAGVISSLIVGFTRVYLGVHFPGDVLAGYGFGILFGLFVSAVFYPLVGKKKHGT
jgi:undecaprenyl-diphosphatase